jgi:hypothetical protein
MQRDELGHKYNDECKAQLDASKPGVEQALNRFRVSCAKLFQVVYADEGNPKSSKSEQFSCVKGRVCKDFTPGKIGQRLAL